jgi:hypothetical protein
MAEKKSPVQRFSMMVAPGKTATLGYWPPELDHTNNGWTGQAFAAHRDTLAIAKKYSDQNESLFAAQQAKSAPPDLGDVVTRHQRAKQDYKRLAELGHKLQQIDSEVSKAQSQLRPYDYSGDSLRDAMLRQERRAHMRNNMSESERHTALRSDEWRKAALETDASLSGVAPTFHRAMAEEELRAKYPDALKGVADARQAIEAVGLAMDAAAKALEFEMQQTASAVPGPAPAESPPWVKAG